MPNHESPYRVEPVSWFYDPLDDDLVEWSVEESTSSIGTTEWRWVVAVGKKSQGSSAYSKWDATHRARSTARRMLGKGARFGKTRPCPLCGKPSLPGSETDTNECDRLLAAARAELPKPVL